MSLEAEPLGWNLHAVRQDKEKLGANGRPQLTFEYVRPVEDSEYIDLHTAISDVSHVLKGFIVFVRQAILDLNNSALAVYEAMATHEFGRDTERWRIELNYRVLAVCAALRMYEEFTFAELRRKYGRESEYELEAKSILSRTYDSCFAYRLLINLRNALVHGSTSLLNISATESRPNGDAGRIVHHLEIKLNREAFARSSVKAPIRHEVGALADNPELLSLCDDVLEPMEDLNGWFNALLVPRLEEHIAILANITMEAASKGGYPTLMKLKKSGIRPTAAPEKVSFPWDVISVPEPVRDFVVTILNQGFGEALKTR